MRAGILSEAFFADEEERRALGVEVDRDKPSSVVVELNLLHKEGLNGAESRFLETYNKLWKEWKTHPPPTAPLRIADTYYRCRMSVRQAQKLVDLDVKGTS